MHLSWYGGGPMLNQDAINYLSAKVIGYCDEFGVRYTASMVSNGTVWPRDPSDAVRFVSGNRIGSIQFRSIFQVQTHRLLGGQLQAACFHRIG